MLQEEESPVERGFKVRLSEEETPDTASSISDHSLIEGRFPVLPMTILESFFFSVRTFSRLIFKSDVPALQKKMRLFILKKPSTLMICLTIVLSSSFLSPLVSFLSGLNGLFMLSYFSISVAIICSLLFDLLISSFLTKTVVLKVATDKHTCSSIEDKYIY